MSTHAKNSLVRSRRVGRGFTLIEILVSVAIFAVVMVIALGALLSISVSDRKAESLKAVINNLNFAMDSMSRAIRTGYGYSCAPQSGGTGNCTSGGYSFSFTPSGGGSYTYRLEDTATDPSNAAAYCNQLGIIGCIVRSTDGGDTWSALTAPEVVICGSSTGGNCPSGSSDNLFYLIGAPPGSSGDTVQPKVTMVITGYVQVTATQQSVFHLQTSVTQRLYDQ